ncbi:hypothetical protein GTA51_12985 [Desulfovibrio aerotolerans]|uniref:Integrase catalytic domain-containing protein n=1 Tax=Solidesulfovibrio aerotolerans TaxID=295255 RepID=A0A7C9IMK2_9BACT|nr:hypothetical protein [Solidesulfovibrio aerotolerans]
MLGAGCTTAWPRRFVKTFKRDQYVHDRPDAQTVLSQLAAWFEDYNEVHPRISFESGAYLVAIEAGHDDVDQDQIRQF